nr:deoxyribodipyrimidine photo-lyase-like [Nerophis lumbriciformis]
MPAGSWIRTRPGRRFRLDSTLAMDERPTLVWFWNDLRLRDHAALRCAAERGPVLPVFVLDDRAAAGRALGAASRGWLHHSLCSLSSDISSRGGQLILRYGDTLKLLASVAAEVDAQALVFHKPMSLGWLRYNNAYMTDCGLASRHRVGDATPKAAPANAQWWAGRVESDVLTDWGLLPAEPDWSSGLKQAWYPGEKGARKRLRIFVNQVADDYPHGGDRPDLAGTSLSTGDLREDAGWSFLRELGWREFSYHLLAHFPTLDRANFKSSFDHFPWRQHSQELALWQRAGNGSPAAELTPHAYFRIFNPIKQGERFDPNGDYVRQWVPELAALPNRYLNKPWESPAEVLQAAGVVLGKTYPSPIVDHRAARERALAAYQQIRSNR